MEKTLTGENIEPVFSIIIPHYNSPRLLPRLLSSIPLDREDIQVIVVDDRSDKDIELLMDIKRKYKDRIEFYRNNNGRKSAGAARNIGLKHARGKWLIFADSDDYFSGSFSKMIDEYRESECDIIYFSADSIDNVTGKRSDRHEKIEKKVKEYCAEPSRANENRLRFTVIEPFCKMIKRNLVEENHIRFSESIAANDKWFSTLAGFHAGKIDARDEVLYVITRTPGSLTQKKDEKAYNDRMKEGLKQIVFLKRVLSREQWGELELNPGWLFTSAAYIGYSGLFIFKWMAKYLIKGVRPVSFDQLKIVISVKRNSYRERFQK